MQDQTFVLEDTCQKFSQGLGDLLELGKYQNFFSFFIDGFTDFTESDEFPAFFFTISADSEVLIRGDCRAV